MKRTWLLTWHTYGTWLPGDRRGFVSPVKDASGRRVIHNMPGTPVAADMLRLRQYAERVMRAPRRFLTTEDAQPLLAQFCETAQFRGWTLHAVAILPTHVHVLVSVTGDPAPATILRDLKSYGSRRLNQVHGTGNGCSWWSKSGSTRVVKSESHLRAAIRYVLEKQQNPLLTYAGPTS